jgi:GNAT superfamily N-acetyltransferase
MPITKLGKDAVSEGVVKELSKMEVMSLRQDIKDLPAPNIGGESKAYGYFVGTDLAGLIIIDVNPSSDSGFYRSKKKDLGHDQEINFFWVYPEYRGSGVGKKLLNFVISTYGVSNYLGLGTGKLTTESAKHLYSDFGFKPIMNVGKNSWWLRKKEKELSEVLI